VLAVFHMADINGPARINHPRLRALTADGELRVIVPGHGATEELYRPLAAVDVRRYGPLDLPRSMGDLASALAEQRAAVRTFRAALRDYEPDLMLVVTTSLPAALLAARLEGVPAVVDVMEVLHVHHEGGAPRMAARFLVRAWTAALADALICCSNLSAEGFKRMRRRGLHVIYPGIELDRPEGDGTRLLAERGIQDAGPYIAAVGNITFGRGQDVLIRALPAVRETFPDARLLLAGMPLRPEADAAYRKEFRNLAGALGVSEAVIELGYVEDTASLYAAADVVVNPARFHEPFGLVAIEALAAGRPVVASRVGAIPEILEDEHHALLVEPEAPVALGEAIVRVLSDDALRRRLVEGGRARVARRFDQRDGAERFVAAVDEALARRAHGRRRFRRDGRSLTLQR
jgi:glycosyltransferase involved in cell wall biosynthesis